VLEVEVLDHELAHGLGGETSDASRGPGASELSREEIERLCARTLATAGIEDGHLAVEFVSPERIAQLNAEYRGKEGPTDVLSFPIDEAGPLGASDGMPRELGDIVICPLHTVDLREAIVHGTLHLLGMDHETDDGEMLALQDAIISEEVS
jgi:probable rRNA maturation factor